MPSTGSFLAAAWVALAILGGRASAQPFSVVHAFENGSGSAVPFGSVFEHDGWLYSTTAMGGISVTLGTGLHSRGSGTVWRYRAVPEPSTPAGRAGVMLVAALGLCGRSRAPAARR